MTRGNIQKSSLLGDGELSDTSIREAPSFRNQQRYTVEEGGSTAIASSAVTRRTRPSTQRAARGSRSLDTGSLLGPDNMHDLLQKLTLQCRLSAIDDLGPLHLQLESLADH